VHGREAEETKEGGRKRERRERNKRKGGWFEANFSPKFAWQLKKF
jgi:hypothetical protein